MATAQARKASVVFGFALLTIHVTTAAVAQHSLMKFHREIREAVIHEVDIRQRVRRFIEETGDYSFEAFLLPASQLLAAIKAQKAALEDWSRKDYDAAIAHFQQALRLLRSPQAASEAAFCAYYIAEILAEQERLTENLEWLAEALKTSGSTNRPYLEGVIFQSQGYSLWYLDHLPASIGAFARALEHWENLAFAPGVISCWNNLAALYEELRLWSRAEDAYQQALRRVGPDLDAEIRFYLFSNYAFFLKERHRDRDADIYLELARELSFVSPQELQLLEWKIRPRAQATLDAVLQFQPSRPSLEIERLLLLAELYENESDRPEARRHLETAMRETEPASLRYYRRKAARGLGQWLEQEGLYEDAAALYTKTLQQEHNISDAELIFPYSRVASPLLTALVRCLIRLGRTEDAWKEIQRFAYLRKMKAERVLSTESTIKEPLDDRHPLLLTRLFGDSSSRPATDGDWLQFDLTPALIARLDGNVTLIEMWPDRASVHAWIVSGSGWRYQELALPREPAQLVEQLLGPLYSAHRALPPPPPPRLLQRLYRDLFHPLEPLLRSQRVLVVAHGELQSLPFEMLQDDSANYLLHRYDFSYLPASHWLLDRNPNRHSGRPALVVPAGALAEVDEEETRLKSLFPDLEIFPNLENEFLTDRRWVHISTHFRLDDPWAASGFSDARGELNLIEFLKAPLSCRLLSLGVCDAGNSYASASPYRLGFSELFLTRGAEALIVNRWRLDELSSRIYRDFYKLCREGWSMDTALTSARRAFLRTDLSRDGTAISGAHPFFWGGITYIGLPGERLYPAESHRAEIILWSISLALLLGSSFVLIALRRS